MYKMNGWKKDCKAIESQADTYIERRFEESCQLLYDGNNIINEWRDRKREYIAYTGTTVFDFQHYSRHDATHSINILESVEMILGKMRVELLSAGDLWLLLESAYFHDIGMSLKYEELLDLWKDEDFQKYIKDNLNVRDADMKDASLWYIQMDNLLHDRKKMESIEKEEEIDFDETWPLEWERRLLLLVSEYIRKDHANRAKKFLMRFGDSGRIQNRLYRMVVEISAVHGDDFDAVMQLKKKEKGFGIDTVHPRFIAALLRLGDLLDMDNNRFNIRALEHYGRLPRMSELHLKKHKSLTHIFVCEKKICASAENAEYDVCRVTRDWFDYIENETKNFICSWNRIAPHELGGCLMSPAACVVYCPKEPIVFEAKSQQKFEVDKIKLTNLLIGTNIYDTRLDFLREYIQNALDATRMQIWLDISEGKYNELWNPDILNQDELAPFDLPQSIYEQYAIEVRIEEICMEKQTVVIVVTDKGIGMEEGCVDTIAKIGAGWRERQKYSGEILKMLKWLRPTGGFGIGIQSAFMVTDQVEIKTRARGENKARKIILNSPRKSGDVVVEIGDMNYPQGTSVKIELDLEYFQKWNREVDVSVSEEDNCVQNLIGRIPFERNDIFNREETLTYVMDYIEKYICRVIVNPLVPIWVSCRGYQKRRVPRRYTLAGSYWENDALKKSEWKVKDKEWDYRCFYCAWQNQYFGSGEQDNVLVLWNETDQVYTCIHRKEREKAKAVDAQDKGVLLNFKNICVVREQGMEKPYTRFFDVCMDFLGQEAEYALKVHRNSFDEGFRDKIDMYLESSIRVFFRYMHQMEAQVQKNSLNESKSNTHFPYKLESAKSKIYAENLWSMPMPFVRELYFEKVDLENIPKAEEDQGVEGFILGIIGDEDLSDLLEQGKKSVVTFMPKLIGINVMMLRIRALLHEAPEKESPVLFMDLKLEDTVRKQMDNNEEGHKLQISQKVVRAWYKKEPAGTRLRKKEYDILEKLRGSDYFVLSNRALVELLLNKPEFDYYEVIIENAGNFLMVTKKRDKKARGVDEDEFYRRSYIAGTDRKRYICRAWDENKYKEIWVKTIPYYRKGEMSTEDPYIISPIDNDIYMHIELKWHPNGQSIQGRKYSFDDFLREVTSKESYKALLTWVFKNQYEEDKYTRPEIEKTYTLYLEEIYRHMIGE